MAVNTLNAIWDRGGALDMDDQVKDRITISLRAGLTISGADYALFLDGNFHCSYGPSGGVAPYFA